MMRAFLVLTRLRMAEVVRDPATALFVFCLPPLLLLLVSLVFRDGHPFERRRVLLVPGTCDLQKASARLAGGDVRVAVTSDAHTADIDLLSHVVSGLVVCSGDQGFVVRVEARNRRFGESLARALRMDASDARDLEVVPDNPTGYARYVFGGFVAYVLLLQGLFGMGYAMARYRQARFLKKLSTTPLRPLVFILAQLSARSVIVFVQVLLLMAMALWAVELRLSAANALVFLIAALLGLWTAMAIGFALACVVHNADLLLDAISLAGIPIIFLSEVFFPLDVLPAPIASAAGLLPSTALVRLLRQAVAFSSDAVPLANLAILAAWALACSALTWRVFRFSEAPR